MKNRSCDALSVVTMLDVCQNQSVEEKAKGQRGWRGEEREKKMNKKSEKRLFCRLNQMFINNKTHRGTTSGNDLGRSGFCCPGWGGTSFIKIPCGPAVITEPKIGMTEFVWRMNIGRLRSSIRATIQPWALMLMWTCGWTFKSDLWAKVANRHMSVQSPVKLQRTNRFQLCLSHYTRIQAFKQVIN